jgi:DNA topoisomerase-1
MNVVVVESPSKAKTINKYLGPGYKVLASFGHVRDLPAKDGSVLPDQDFEMLWEVDTASAKRMKDIADAVKSSDGLFLATDPDREGEAISWHVLDMLNKKRVLGGKTVKRVVFNAITKKAVLDAMANPRDIDVPLVDAYLARRALDYLVGFNLSPVLWRKLPGARSAGRVQSVALRLVCDRESEIERFISEEYWNLSALLKTPRGDEFEAKPGCGRMASGCSRVRSPTARTPASCARCLKAPPTSSIRSKRSRSSATRDRPSQPRRCSRQRRQNSASRPRAPCRWRRSFTKASR